MHPSCQRAGQTSANVCCHVHACCNANVCCHSAAGEQCCSVAAGSIPAAQLQMRRPVHVEQKAHGWCAWPRSQKDESTVVEYKTKNIGLIV